MRCSRVLLVSGALTLFLPIWQTTAQSGSADQPIELDGSDLNRQMREREAKINSLPVEERQRLRVAQEKAAIDPEVKAAMKKRDEALRELNMLVREKMLRDPAISPILQKLAQPPGGG